MRSFQSPRSLPLRPLPRLQVEQAAKDLCTDFCGGKRRIIPVQQMRLTGAAAAGKQVSILGKATKQARKLIITCVVPRFYSYATMGCSPTSQKKMTAVITNAGGYRKAGGCATTALFLHQLLRAHPMVQFPLEIVVECAACECSCLGEKAGALAARR